MATGAVYHVGEFEITIVSDGYTRMDGGAVFGLVPRVLWEPVVGSENLDAEHRVHQGLNCMLVRRGDDVLLIETGMGNKHDETYRTKIFPGQYGSLLTEMAAAGVQPQAVTAVANTHLHTDHCGWNTVERDGEIVPTFSSARYFIQAREYEDAMNPNDRTRASYLPENIEPIDRAGQLELVDGEREIIPGVHFLPLPGHTAGHAAIVISSKGETAICTGDMAHHAVQLERDAWISAFDVLPLVSLETKKTLMARAIRENALIVSVHNPFPGVGRMSEENGRRKFEPV